MKKAIVSFMGHLIELNPGHGEEFFDSLPGWEFAQWIKWETRHQKEKRMSEDYSQDFLFGKKPSKTGPAAPVHFSQPLLDPYETHKKVLGVLIVFYLMYLYYKNTKPLSAIIEENSILLLTIIISLTVHECAHAWTNFSLGDPTARNEGRISLNPLVHIDWLGLLCFFLGGLGWAKPVPFNPSNFRDVDRGVIMSACAGPISNFLLAFLGCFFLKIELVTLRGFALAHPTIGGLIMGFTDFFIILNIAIGYFNLIPLPPLDGSLALKHMLPKDQRGFMEGMEKIGPILLMLFISTNIPRNVLNPLILWTYNLLHTLIIGSA